MDDLPDPASFSLPIRVNYLGAETQPYCTAIENFMKQTGALLYSHNQLSKRQIHQSRLEEVAGSFKKDKEVTENTIEAGKEVAATEVGDLLTDRFHEVRMPHNLSDEEEHKGRLLLSRGIDKDEQARKSLGWGNVANDTEVAMRELCFVGEPHEMR